MKAIAECPSFISMFTIAAMISFATGARERGGRCLRKPRSARRSLGLEASMPSSGIASATLAIAISALYRQRPPRGGGPGSRAGTSPRSSRPRRGSRHSRTNAGTRRRQSRSSFELPAPTASCSQRDGRSRRARPRGVSERSGARACGARRASSQCLPPARESVPSNGIRRGEMLEDARGAISRV